MSHSPPDVPQDRLREEGWDRIEDTTDTLAALPGVTVRGHTVVYGDERLRAAVADATDPPVDQPWRFFFATRLWFEPPPPRGIGATMFASIVRSRARSGFADRLRERGYESVERTREKTVRIATGERATLTRFTGRDLIDTGDRTRAVPVEGWVGVWHHDDFFVAGGAYPAQSLSDALELDIETDPERHRSELFSLVRAVR